jgi:hypothetical protein
VPIVFISHSFGGIVIKEVCRNTICFHADLTPSAGLVQAWGRGERGRRQHLRHLFPRDPSPRVTYIESRDRCSPHNRLFRVQHRAAPLPGELPGTALRLGCTFCSVHERERGSTTEDRDRSFLRKEAHTHAGMAVCRLGRCCCASVEAL